MAIVKHFITASAPVTAPVSAHRQAMSLVSRAASSEVIEPRPASRFDRFLAPRRQRNVHTYGFAPDLPHGARELGAIYEVMPEVDGVLMVSALELGQGARLLTLGRWSGGFLDVVQAITGPGRFDLEVEDRIMALFEGASAVLGTVGADLRIFQEWLCGQGYVDEAQRLDTCALVPVALHRADLLEREARDLGLAREDLTDDGLVQSVARLALEAAEPMALQRVLEAGRADLLTTVALLTDRRARNLPR